MGATAPHKRHRTALDRYKQVVSMGLPASRIRFIALSATLPNANDFGAFLGAEVFRFGDEFRPVPLQVRYRWHGSSCCCVFHCENRSGLATL